MPEHQMLSYGSNPALWSKSLFFTVTSIIFIITIGYFLPNKKYKIIFTQFIGVLLFFRFAFLHGYMLGMEHWNIVNSLPFHLCGISSLSCIFIMLYINSDNKYNQPIFEYLVLLGIPSGLHSILTPEFIHGWDGFYFPEFYISHGAIFLVPIYLTVVFDYKIRSNSWKTAFSNILIMVVPFIALINYLIGANYMYLCKSPIADNPLLLTNQWPYYVPMIIFFVFLHNLAIFYIYKLIGRVE